VTVLTTRSSTEAHNGHARNELLRAFRRTQDDVANKADDIPNNNNIASSKEIGVSAHEQETHGNRDCKSRNKPVRCDGIPESSCKHAEIG